VHPLVKAMLETSRSAAYHAAQLGLWPASAKRVYPERGRGRPMGAVSAPDRKAGAPPVLTLAATAAARVNRARGSQPRGIGGPIFVADRGDLG